jgi:hypothetical protein
MKKFLFYIAMVLVLASSGASASDTNSLFKGNEFSLSLRSGYNVNAFGAQKVSEAFAAPYNFNLSAGAQYYVTKYLGFEANVPFYQSQGVSFSEVQAGVLARLPVFHYLAPYAGVGGGYNWIDKDNFSYIAKAGIEARLNKGWGVFVESNYRNRDFNFEKGAVTVNGGLRLVFW